MTQEDRGFFIFANKKTSFISNFCTIDLGILSGTLDNHFGHLCSCLCIKTIDCAALAKVSATLSLSEF